MKRKFLIVLLALTLAIVSAFTLTACGETEKPDGGNGDNGNSTVVTPGGDTDNNGGSTIVKPGGDTDNNGGDNVEPHTHAFTAEVATDKYLVSRATCTAKAKYYYSCACGEKGMTTFEYGEMPPHTYDKQVTTDEYLATPATNTEKAKYYYSCACGKKGTATFEYGNVKQIEVKVYIDGEYDSSVYTDSTKKYLITPPEKPEDISTNPNEERYFYGWFVDSNFQTPLTDRTTFKSNSKIYAKWISVRSSYYTYTVSSGKATITGLRYYDDASTVLVVPAYVNSFPVESIAKDAFKDRTMVRSVVICNGIKNISGFSGCNSILDWSDVSIPESVEVIDGNCFENCSFVDIDIPYGVKTIEAEAFKNCQNLISVTMPNSVTSIGYGAFNNCSSLTSITIPNGVTGIWSDVFSGCSSLTNVTIPNGVTVIGNRAFSGCRSLTSVTIPNGVTSIGIGAFSGCSSLTSITIPNSVTRIGSGAFRGCSSLESITLPFVGETKDSTEYEGAFGYIFGCIRSSSGSGVGGTTQHYEDYYYYIPESLKTVKFNNTATISIKSPAFYNCSSLTSITLSDSVTCIEDHAFFGCSSLTDITLSNSVTSIGDGAFRDCSSLTSITIPNGVTSIGNQAFENCRSLTSITIPNSVTSIGEYAFSGCYRLAEVYNLSALNIKKGESYNNVYVGYYAYDVYTNKNIPSKLTRENGFVIHTDGNVKTLVGYFGDKTEIAIPNSVTSIGEYAFYDCRSLTSVTIPNSVTSIGEYAFYDCRSLTSVTIPNGVTVIGDRAFYWCTKLTSITIPDSVMSIGDSAFSNCSSLTSITIPGSVTSIGDYAFSNCRGLETINCKAESQPSGWSNNWKYNCSAEVIWGYKG